MTNKFNFSLSLNFLGLSDVWHLPHTRPLFRDIAYYSMKDRNSVTHSYLQTSGTGCNLFKLNYVYINIPVVARTYCKLARP